MEFPSTYQHCRFQADDCLNNTLGNLDIRMIEFGYAPDPFPWDVLDENCDPWFRLYYMPRESAYLQVDDRSVELKSKHLHLIPPRLKFRYDLNYKAPHLWLHFFSEELTQVLPKEVFSIPFDNTDLFTPIIYNMQKERAENSEATLEVNLLCRSLLNGCRKFHRQSW